MNARTGEILCRDRSFSGASALKAGERVIVLDEDGIVALATYVPGGVQIHGKLQILENKGGTPPTLVG